MFGKVEHLSEEKKKYENDKFLIETVAKRYNLLDYINFDSKDDNILKEYKHDDNDRTKYIATSVEAILGEIYRESDDINGICKLVETWMKFDDK